MLEAGKLEAKRVLSYRVDFWLQFVVTAAAEVIVAYYLWSSIYTDLTNQKIGGYTFHEMLLYYIFVPLVGRVVRSQDDWQVSRDIYDGSLTRFLIFPISFLHYKFLQKTSYSLLTVLQMFIALLVIQFVFRLDVPWSLQNFALGLFATFCSMYMYNVISISLELFAFWAEVVWSLGVMMRFITMFFGGAMVPLSLFPKWSLNIIKYTPFPYMYSVPIKIFLGQATLTESFTGIGITVLWIVPFWFCMMFIYRRGLYSYTGVGI
jgi:ABC-2 type transport system permease protein